MKILLSIKPEFVAKIFDGEKHFEFRKRKPKKDFDKVIIYEWSPTQNIVGWFSVKGVIEGHPDEIWNNCKNVSGIENDRFFQYCNGNKIVYAFEIKESHKFDKPINPFEVMPGFTPPQNFAYLESDSIFTNLLDTTGVYVQTIDRCHPHYATPHHNEHEAHI